MRRIAHISDVHILGSQSQRSSARYRFATTFVNWGRSPDPSARARKLARSLRAVKDSGADHLVISGDLTEVGEASEYERFAEILEDAKLPPDGVTLVPGNHDMYSTPHGWRDALAGPLAPFARASATEPGKVVDCGDDAVILPIDSSCFQSIALAGGQFTGAAATAIERRLVDPAFRDKTMILVMHHSPVEHKTPVMHFMDGFRGAARLLELLAKHPRLVLLHGHLHRFLDRIVSLGKLVTQPRAGGQGRPRLFGAPGTCDDREDAAPRIRLYAANGGGLEAA